KETSCTTGTRRSQRRQQGMTAESGWSWISRELAEGCEKELTTKPSQNREQRLAFIVTAVLKV
ncbi:hypothetical protein, partial [Serratia marcescens]|uniref:hypothetical protein n=1 Tax=Serratia marcescens TaxID=615 RepID=UPI001CC0784F